MSNLAEKIAKLREFGLGEKSDSELHHLLRRAGFNLDGAINQFFEDEKEGKKSCNNRLPRDDVSYKQTTEPTIEGLKPNISNQYLIGRKVVYGYLLSTGYVTQNCHLTFSLEVIDTVKEKHSKKKAVGTNKGIAASKIQPSELKLKKTFSAAELIFTTARSIARTEFKVIDPVRGRLSNKVCDFLLPLLKCELISIVGNFAYDIGEVRVFQDVPIVLNIFVDKIFFSRIMEQSLDYSKQGFDKCVIESLHNMLLWLASDNFIDNSTTDKKPVASTSSLLTTSEPRLAQEAGIEDETDAEQQPTMNVDEIIDPSMSTKPKSSELQLQLPLLVEDVTLKAYQVEAVHWMIERETNTSADCLGNVALPPHHIKALQSECDGFLKENSSSSTDTVQVVDIDDEESDSTELWTRVIAVRWNSIRINPNDISNVLKSFSPSNETVVFFWWNRFSRLLRLQPPDAPRACRGGILAHDMGMGKTLMAICLISEDAASLQKQNRLNVLNIKSEAAIQVTATENCNKDVVAVKRSQPSEREEDTLIDSSSSSRSAKRQRKPLAPADISLVIDLTSSAPLLPLPLPPRLAVPSISNLRKLSSPKSVAAGTLIICPMSLMGQWMEEINSKTKHGALSVLMYYGNNRQSDLTRVTATDIVVTSYGVLVSEFQSLRESFAGNQKSTFFQQSLLTFHWHRVVLDEAHTIKNAATEVNKACCSIIAERRWALTGTPIQNSLNDMQSLVKFLQHEPWNEARWWKKTISDPHALGDKRAISLLRRVLQDIMLRRTKDDKDEHGVPIIELSKKECHVIKVTLSPEEREFYDALLRRSKALCKRYNRVYDGHVKRNSYAALLTLLLHLRQACNHPFLVFGKSKTNSSSAPEKNSSSAGNVKKVVAGEEEDDPEALGDDDNLLGQTFLNSILRKLQRSIEARLSNQDKDAPPVVSNPPSITDGQQSSSSSSSAKEDGDDDQQYECPICYETFQVGAEWISLSCGHRFCGDCIKASVERFKVCATCQQPLRQGDVVNVTSYLHLNSAESKNSSKVDELKDIINHQQALETKSSSSNGATDMLTSWRNWGDAKFKNGSKLNSVQQNYLNMNWRSSSKLEALMSTLETVFKRRLQCDDSSSGSSSTSGGSSSGGSVRIIKPRKVVIFSQWTSMMDLIELAIQSHNSGILDTTLFDNSSANTTAAAEGAPRPVRYVFSRLDGTMSQQQREIAVSKFNKDVEVNIFLVSLKAGGVGLNLVAASAVVLVDPWWNPSTEDQAIDRIHRLGQTVDVDIYRLICQDSVEERLLSLQDVKRKLSQQVMGSAEKAAAGQQQMKLSIDELRSFFNDD